MVRKMVRKNYWGRKILDIGCASGHLIKELIADGVKKEHLTGIDISEEAINACHDQGYHQTHVMDGGNPTFETETFDLIVSSDCLEHIEDDKKALENWHKILKVKGRAIIFVPAFQFLWTKHDEVNHHFRRYTKKELKEKCKEAGFTIVRSGYWNTILFSLVAAIRIVNKNGSDDLNLPGPLVNGAFKLVMRLENTFHRFFCLFPGVSTFVVVEKS
jgi:SAM-dependent methyltransferase